MYQPLGGCSKPDGPDSLSLKSKKRRFIMKPKHIIGIVVIILFIVFLVQNTQVVTLRFYFWKLSMSQIILLPLTMIIGVALGYIIARVTGKGPKRDQM